MEKSLILPILNENALHMLHLYKNMHKIQIVQSRWYKHIGFPKRKFKADIWSVSLLSQIIVSKNKN